MYQLPVENLERIRKPRKSVKNILYDIGLDSCKVLLEVSVSPLALIYIYIEVACIEVMCRLGLSVKTFCLPP